MTRTVTISQWGRDALDFVSLALDVGRLGVESQGPRYTFDVQWDGTELDVCLSFRCSKRRWDHFGVEGDWIPDDHGLGIVRRVDVVTDRRHVYAICEAMIAKVEKIIARLDLTVDECYAPS